MEEILTQYGLAGIVITVLAGVTVYQNKRNESLQRRIDELQDLRLGDSKKTVEDVTKVLEGNSQSIRILTEKIEIARGNNVVVQ